MLQQWVFSLEVWRLARLEAPVVVSANCLLAGHVLYLDENQGWVETLASAHLFQSLEEASAVAVKVNDPSRVIGIELVGVTLQATLTVARHYREAIRANGPGEYVFPSLTGEADVSVQ